MRVQEKFQNKLFVEGNDDQHIIWAICQQFSVAETFDVKDCMGKDKMLNLLSKTIPLMTPDVKLGVVIDADEDISSRWESVRDNLQQVGYSVPKDIPENGLIVETSRKPKVGIWLMPDNKTQGMIEDFVKYLIPVADELLPETQRILHELESKRLNRYNASLHHSKAFIHTWLAWQENPGTPMGLAITKTYLTTNIELCKRFVSWLNKLFNE